MVVRDAPVFLRAPGHPVAIRAVRADGKDYRYGFESKYGGATILLAGRISMPISRPSLL